MKTNYFKILSPDSEDIKKVASILRDGGVAAIPTETVYGLAGNALKGQCVRKIYEAKGRPSDNPLIVHISDISQWAPLVKHIPESAMALAEKFWPGPLTIILPKSELIPDEICGGLSTVAVRMPSDEIARAIITECGFPLAAPSANTSGKPSPTCAQHVKEDLDGKIEVIVDSGECSVGIESTVITLATDIPRLLRPGGITPEMLTEVLGEDTAEEGDVALCFEEEVSDLNIRCITYGRKDDPSSQAKNIFDALRKVDSEKAKTVFARFPESDGIGLAVFNRLVRAAAFNIIEV